MRIFSLRAKLFMSMAAASFAFALLFSLITYTAISRLLKEERISDTRSLATSMSLHLVDPLLIGDLVAVDNYLSEIKKSNPRVAYIFIEKDTRVVAHTFADGFPEKLLNLHEGHSGKDHLLLRNGSAGYRDFAVPIYNGRAGVLRMGIYANAGSDVALQIGTALLYAALPLFLAALAGSSWLSRKLTRPISELTAAAGKIARGDYMQEIAAEGQNEIGQLAASFRTMVSEVLLRENELRRINEELEATNVVLHEHIESLRKTRDELVRTQQDKAVVDTARAFLHHIRQPLTYLIMSIDMLTEYADTAGPADAELQRRRLLTVQEAGVRLGDLLKKFENLRAYNIVTYGDEVRIVDIDQQ